MPKESRSKKYLGISVDRAVLQEIDQSRGLIKRSTFVNELLKMLLHDNIPRPTAKGSVVPSASPTPEKPNRALIG